MKWTQYHDMANRSTDWRLVIEDSMVLTEIEVGQCIQAMMSAPRPNQLYYGLVSAVSELGDLKRAESKARADAEEAAAKRQRWENAKWDTDANGFETSGSAKGDDPFGSFGGEAFTSDTFAEAMRKLQEEIMRSAGRARPSDFGDAFAYGFAGNHRQQSNSDYFRQREAHFKVPPKPGARDWWVVIGCMQGDNRAAINAAYRKRAMAIHKDKLGEEAMKELNVAKDLAFKLVLS